MEKFQSLAEFLGTVPESCGIEDSAPSDAEVTVKDFCRGILTSPEYRRSILHRVTLGTLPPAVECRMYEYAYGKPPERVEHTGKDGKPIETITEVRRLIVHVAQSEVEERKEAVH